MPEEETKPVKPSKTAPALRVVLELILPDLVIVPEPDKVPFNIIRLESLTPTLGSAPKGKVQSLLTILVLVLWAKVTRLKVTLPQARVGLPVVPSKVKVPEL